MSVPVFCFTNLKLTPKEAMMNYWIKLLALTIVVGLAAPAAGETIIRKRNADGTIQFKVQPSTTYDTEGLPITPLTGSISIEDEDTTEIVFCIPVGETQAEQEQVFDFNIIVPPPAAGQKRDMRARAWEDIACAGTVFSVTSVRDQRVLTGPPGRADLLP